MFIRLCLQVLPQQQQPLPAPPIEEEDVAFMGLQDHYDWIKQQQELLLQQQQVNQKQQMLLQNYVHLPDQCVYYSNNDHSDVASGNSDTHGGLETSFIDSNNSNNRNNDTELNGNHGMGPSNQNSNHDNVLSNQYDYHGNIPSNSPPPVPKKKIKNHGVQVLPKLLPRLQLNHVIQESSTDDNQNDYHHINGGNQDELTLRGNVRHERFRSISPIVEYLNESNENSDETRNLNNQNRDEFLNNKTNANVPITIIL